LSLSPLFCSGIFVGSVGSLCFGVLVDVVDFGCFLGQLDGLGCLFGLLLSFVLFGRGRELFGEFLSIQLEFDDFPLGWARLPGA